LKLIPGKYSARGAEDLGDFPELLNRTLTWITSAF
jgi:hypothetical protein